MSFPVKFEHLVDALKKLPGVGTKSAERMAYRLLDMDKEVIHTMVTSIVDARETLHSCSKCGHLTDQVECNICTDRSRDTKTVCVVQSSKDVFAFERGESFKGVYHVLHGAISPVNGIGPTDLNITSLIGKIQRGEVNEVILATNPNVEGETTALYLAKLLERYEIKITRLAYGLSVGASLDYTDDFTLMKAMQGRKQIGG